MKIYPFEQSKGFKSLSQFAVSAFGAVIFLSAGSAKALTFNFNPLFDTTTAQGAAAMAGFQEAGAYWSAVFTDNVVVNYDLGFADLGTGIIAQAGSNTQSFLYTDVFNALVADVSSFDDNIAVSSLQNTRSLKLLINRTSNSPHGYGSEIPYLDNDRDTNNKTIGMATANAKALGLIGANPFQDGFLTFNSSFNYDFDRNDSWIAPGTFDFVAIAVHEIGHALGFISGVDVLDRNSPPFTNAYTDAQFSRTAGVSTLDLFRYSDLSFAQGAIDWTVDNRDKYFSIDGGVTKKALFSNGRNLGDGAQASHWKDDLGIGIMDPTFDYGELGLVAPIDVIALDVIGWDMSLAAKNLYLNVELAKSKSKLETSVLLSSKSKSTSESSTFLALVALGAGLLLKQNKPCRD
jgi:hypothetical protein